jgi:hypothetical protein
MGKPKLVEALDIHAEGLQEGLDLAPALVAQATWDDQRLSGLLSVAGQVKSVLVPVEPRPGFVTDLKTRLLANASQVRKVNTLRHEQERKVILGALAGVGGLLYVVSLAFLSLRMVLMMVSLVGTLLGWWLTRPLLSRSRRAR